MFGAKYVTNSNSIFHKYESVSRDITLLLTIFIAENSSLYVYVTPKQHNTGQYFLVMPNFHKVTVARS